MTTQKKFSVLPLALIGILYGTTPAFASTVAGSATDTGYISDSFSQQVQNNASAAYNALAGEAFTRNLIRPLARMRNFIAQNRFSAQQIAPGFTPGSSVTSLLNDGTLQNGLKDAGSAPSLGGNALTLQKQSINLNTNVASLCGEGNSSTLANNCTVTRMAVSAVPVPAALWLFGSGLLGLAGMARRKLA